MNDEPLARKAMRAAERGVRDDASRLVASVPGLLREAALRRNEAGAAAPSLVTLANWALPRFAAATLVAVIVAATVALWEREPATTTATVESVILGGDGDGNADVVFDALLDLEGNDG